MKLNAHEKEFYKFISEYNIIGAGSCFKLFDPEVDELDELNVLVRRGFVKGDYEF